MVRQRLEDRYIPEITKIDSFEGEKVDPPFPISWYPDQLAWAMDTPKKVVRRYPPFASFQKFLVSETSVGNISRQEAVSMIPPLLMDVKPAMTVLDMCAAPGSKAAQLIELVHAGEESRVRGHLDKPELGEQGDIDTANDTSRAKDMSTRGNTDADDDGRATGLLIANDADYKRSHMLIHQMKRLNSPNLIVTNHDATMFPSIRLPSKPTATGKMPPLRYLKFDRILADVPCSGDGTVRKNPNLWIDWHPGNAIGLHQTQARILVRALQMLKVGGRVVYSTCSMNPIENEAVVAAVIDRCGGLAKIGIIDCGGELPLLKRRPGLSHWNVMDKTGRIWSSWAAVEQQREAEGMDGLSRLSESMFPPESSQSSKGEDGQRIPLERCIRIYPYLQDTGAFFITVLEKLSEIRARPESEPKRVTLKAPITAIANEILAKSTVTKTENGTGSVEKIDALDDLLPPHFEKTDDATRATRMNPEIDSLGEGEEKHGRDEEGDAADVMLANKRIKVDEDIDDKALTGQGDRQVHWPPPPAARPDLTLDEAEERVEPAVPRSHHKQAKQPYEEPFKFLSPDHAELDIIYQFYGISSRFPRDRYMVRNATGEPAKAIYYTASLARDILKENEGTSVKFVHSGVKMFVKQDAQRLNTCPWRVQTEGLPILEPWLGENRTVRLHRRGTLRKLLVEMFPRISHDNWQELGEIGERVRDIYPGCCVLRVEPSKELDGFR